MPRANIGRRVSWAEPNIPRHRDGAKQGCTAEPPGFSQLALPPDFPLPLDGNPGQPVLVPVKDRASALHPACPWSKD